MIYLFVILIIIILALSYDFNGRINRDTFILLKKYKTNYLFIGLFITLIAGLRFYVGADTGNYVNDFPNMPSLASLGDFDYLFSRYKPGYVFLVALCKTICNNFLFLQLVVAIFSNTVILVFIWRETNSCFLSVLMYFILNYLEYNFEIMREVMAVSCVLIGFMKYEINKKWQAVIWFIIANLMHVSAIVAIVYPLLYKIRYSSRTLILTVILCFSVTSLYQLIPDFSEYVDLVFGYGDYAEKYLSRDINQDYNLHFYLFHYLKYLIIPAVSLWIVKGNYRFTGFIYMWMLWGVMSIFSYSFYRFNNYFSPFYWLLLASTLVTIFKKIRINKYLLVFGSVVLLLYMHQRSLLSIDEYHGGYKIYERYIPYEMVGFDHNYNINKSQYPCRRGD